MVRFHIAALDTQGERTLLNIGLKWLAPADGTIILCDNEVHVDPMKQGPRLQLNKMGLQMGLIFYCSTEWC